MLDTMEKCFKCKRVVAGQTIGLNQKFLGRHITKFMCFDCLVDFLGTTRETLFDRIRDFIEIEECELFKTEEIENTRDALRKAQNLTLNEKIKITCDRVTEWYYFYRGNVYVSFSGGKDSTVLLHIVRSLFPDVEAVFVNTGLEYPEIQQFVKSFDNVTIIRPKLRFDEVIKKYGYPIIGKEVSQTVWYAKRGSKWAINQINGLDKHGNPHTLKANMYTKYKPLLEVDFETSNKCCLVMKENPLSEIEKIKKPITAIMASESKKRETAWLMTGCNAFEGKKPMSKPMSFWTEQDVLQYIKLYNIPLASVYGDIVYKDDPRQMRLGDFLEDCGGADELVTTGCARTGCVFCAYGCHLERGETRFERLKRTHPRQYDYCINGGEYDENGVWKPNKDGLGMGHVFDELNNIYGDGFIKY